VTSFEFPGRVGRYASAAMIMWPGPLQASAGEAGSMTSAKIRKIATIFFKCGDYTKHQELKDPTGGARFPQTTIFAPFVRSPCEVRLMDEKNEPIEPKALPGIARGQNRRAYCRTASAVDAPASNRAFRADHKDFAGDHRDQCVDQHFCRGARP